MHFDLASFGPQLRGQSLIPIDQPNARGPCLVFGESPLKKGARSATMVLMFIVSLS